MVHGAARNALSRKVQVLNFGLETGSLNRFPRNGCCRTECQSGDCHSSLLHG
jgi:hypothetical protein